MNHRQYPRHRNNGRQENEYDRPPLIRTNASSSSDSLPEVQRTFYYELAPGSMLQDQYAYGMPEALQPVEAGRAAYREPRIHYDNRTWSKERSRTAKDVDPRQSALVVMAVSLFAVSVVAGTVLFAYYILSCYGIY